MNLLRGGGGGGGGGAFSYDNGDEDEESQIKVYRPSELLERSREKTLNEMAAKSKRKPMRIWSDPEYTLIRKGAPLLEDPDDCLDVLQERTLVLFVHNDPDVVFAADPKRPKWKGTPLGDFFVFVLTFLPIGVFKMPPGSGYGEGQYYNPKQDHLAQIYKIRQKKDKPENNIVESRDGSQFPYWVDDWQHVKDNDKKHKDTNKKRKAEQQQKTTTPSSMINKSGKPLKEVQPLDTVVPVDYKHIFPLEGWMQSHATSKGANEKTVMRATMLKQNPAKELCKDISIFIQQLGQVEVGVVEPVTLKTIQKSAPVAVVVPKTPVQLPKPVQTTPPPIAPKKREREPEPPVAPVVQPTALKRVAFAPPIVEKPVELTPAYTMAKPAPVAQDISNVLRALKAKYVAEQYERGNPFEGMDPEEILSDFVKFALKKV